MGRDFKNLTFFKVKIVNNQLIWDTTLDPLDYPKEIREEFFKKSFFYRKKFVSWLGIISKRL